MIHAGAQTTAERVALAAHAAEIGADAVAVIGPPYYALDSESCSHTTPRRRGLRPAPVLPVRVRPAAATRRRARPGGLREHAPNSPASRCPTSRGSSSRGTSSKASRASSGRSSSSPAGLSAGAAGAMSALAGGLPQRVVTAVAAAEPGATEAAGEAARGGCSKFPFQAALKLVLGWQGVAIEPDMSGDRCGVGCERTRSNASARSTTRRSGRPGRFAHERRGVDQRRRVHADRHPRGRR